jgi:hypothetical protein
VRAEPDGRVNHPEPAAEVVNAPEGVAPAHITGSCRGSHQSFVGFTVFYRVISLSHHARPVIIRLCL